MTVPGKVHLGFEVGTGAAVAIPLRHMVVTGQTQEAGKTTTLEALITRAGLRAPVLEPLETDVQADVVRAYEAAGCRIVSFAQGRKTRQTPGIPDLKIYCARVRLTWWHEVKAGDGKQRPAQCAFQAMAESCGETYVLGGLDAALVQLRRIGLVV